MPLRLKAISKCRAYPDLDPAARYHQSEIYQEVIYVLGGEAREHMRLPEELAVGGIMTPRVEEDPRKRKTTRADPWYSTWREQLVLKNDIWKSEDSGRTWSLVTPGCV